MGLGFSPGFWTSDQAESLAPKKIFIVSCVFKIVMIELTCTVFDSH